MRPEYAQMLRFSLVGGIVAVVYVLAYVVFLELNMPQASANGVAFLLCVVVQYVGQTWFTFRQPLGVPDQLFRFTCTIAAGWVVSALITGAIGPALGFAPWLCAAIVTVVLPVQNYIIFRLWVFSRSEREP